MNENNTEQIKKTVKAQAKKGRRREEAGATDEGELDNRKILRNYNKEDVLNINFKDYYRVL